MLEYIIVAILQGLIEWLPISSSGQVMIFAINVLNISPQEAFSLAIWLHLGTSCAVLLKYREDFVKMMKSSFPKYKENENNTINMKKRNWVIIATIGTAITALPLYFVFKHFLENAFTALQGDLVTLLISAFLLITGVILLISKNLQTFNTTTLKEKTGVTKDSLIAGLAQGFSVLPGISRSGLSVSAILYCKYEQQDALKLSFLISVPASFGSILVDLLFNQDSIALTLDISIIFLITIISFAVGYCSMELLLKLAQKVNFGYFCLVYGGIAILIIIPAYIFA
ncbi:MAG: hypothetical protein GF383_13660 [Candidatus Lokiarchaeota archaeon]|nr:hypothetical protein [Candidatus Lokiarchaeota archaeon]MBD3342301.1 hypothetical protein [Candidatus Lokiarchaeota archaeon]